MPTYLAPGVYVEEVPPLARPIAGVGTSTAAFIGRAEDGVTMPAGRTVAAALTPTLVTNWEEFKNNFGDFQTGNLRLALAVFGFFDNGGRTCWVVRVANDGALADLTNALATLEPIDDISIVAAPGVAASERTRMTQHAKKMGDRVAVLDGNDTTTLTVTAINGSDITTSVEENTYGALYFPWIRLRNPLYTVGGSEPEFLSQPPSGHIAGIYARVDGERGVFKAPANVSVFGAIEPAIKISKNQQENLNPKGINIIRAFGGATIVYGARTLGGDLNGEFRYISVRRYMNFLKESIDEGTQFVVFEPNTPALWQRVIRSVGDFLYNQWREGALFGETAKQAFFVKCDAETNPPSVREAGQLITEIGVAIVKPAEFVIFRIQQTTGA
ncbi:MAG: phage tail sheath subtilisin-like domain-containing protein [Bryobacteraceae bacterium]|nr:phage tail sheath subtilisin-like domain-containing protein [Bryobacteraceae bacterium]